MATNPYNPNQPQPDPNAQLGPQRTFDAFGMPTGLERPPSATEPPPAERLSAMPPPPASVPPAAGAPPPPAPPVPPVPSPGAPPVQAMAAASADPAQAGIGQFQAWAQQTFGRAATPQELQTIAGQIGYTGGAITPEQMQAAQQAAQTMARGMGWQGPAAPPTPATPSPNQQVQDAGNQQLIRMLTGNPDAPDPNSPAMVGQRNAFARANQQGTERARLAASERAAQRGTLNAGGFDAEQTGLVQQAAGREADYNAGLMGQEIQAQRGQVMQALQLAQQAGLTREAQALQERLAGLDATLRREGYTLQGQLGRGQLALGYLNSMLNNQQANNALGFNYTALQNSMNQNALSNLLSGLG